MKFDDQSTGPNAGQTGRHCTCCDDRHRSCKRPCSPARDPGIKDAKYYRERGILAYRSGDLYIALANFDLAIEDPGLSDSYINRGIVFHRLGDLKRALSDVAEAKRIDASN